MICYSYQTRLGPDDRRLAECAAEVQKTGASLAEMARLFHCTERRLAYVLYLLKKEKERERDNEDSV
jgi:hypothetical protein